MQSTVWLEPMGSAAPKATGVTLQTHPLLNTAAKSGMLVAIVTLRYPMRPCLVASLSLHWVRNTLIVCLLAVSVGVARTHAAPPLGVDLDHFDHAKQVARLPNGISLGYIDQGPRNGPVVVLIHGYTDSARDWVPLLPYLDPRFRLLLVDIRGHGLSSKPECCYDRVDFAYDIKLLLDTLGIEKADIVGHSLGSLIGQSFAETWPERTRRLVLVSSTGGPIAECPATQHEVASLDFRSEIQKLSDPIDPESPFMIEWWASPTPVDENFLKRQRADAARIPVKVWLAILDQGLTGLELQTALPKIQAPTLLIWGAKDPIFGERDRCSLIHGLPKAQVTLYKDLGHNSFWEEPETVGARLNQFLLDAPAAKP